MSNDVTQPRLLRCEQQWCSQYGTTWLVTPTTVQPGLVAAPADLRCAGCGCSPVSAPLDEVPGPTDEQRHSIFDRILTGLRNLDDR